MSRFSSTRSMKMVLEPVTPVHVWDGYEYMVGLDVILDLEGKTYCVVDLDEIAKSLKLRHEEIIDITKLSKRLILAIQGILRSGRWKDLCKRVGKLPCSITSPSLRIRLLQSTIIPGSTLKGLIRTAVLYYLLKEIAKRDISQLKQIISAGINLYGNLKTASEGLEARLFRSPRLKRQGGYVDSFQSLLVSDPIISEKIELGIMSLHVLDIDRLIKNDLRPIAVMNIEVLLKGRLTYVLHLRGVKTNIALPKPAENLRRSIRSMVEVLNKLNIELIKNSLKEFSYDIIDYESRRIKGINILKHYLDMLNSLRNQVGKNDCFPLRIGFGVGHMSKTIDLLLAKYYSSFYKTLTSVMSEHYGRMWDEKTVKVVHCNDAIVGVGWIRLCLRE